MRRKAKTNEPNLLGRLSANFLAALEADFAENGVAVISQLRQKSPEKYAEIASRLIAAAEPPTSLEDYSRCQSVEDVGRQLLMQMGADESLITPAMVARAVRANERLVGELSAIIADASAGVFAADEDKYVELNS